MSQPRKLPANLSVDPLAQNRGALAVLAPVHAGALSLVIGTDQNAIPTTISRIGGRALGIDWGQQALEGDITRGPAGSEIRICPDWRLPLPFANGTFDNIFLTEWGTVRSESREGGGLHGEVFSWIAECNRLLKDGGTLVVEVPNRFSYLNWLGKASGREHGGWLDLVPRRVTMLYRRVMRRGSDIGETFSHREYLSGFRSAGFNAAKRFIPWPDRLYWFRLWPAEIAAESPLEFWGPPYRAHIAKKVFQFLRFLRIQQWVFPDFIYVMQKVSIDGATSPSSVVEVVGGALSTHENQILELRSYHNSNSVIFMNAQCVFKIPLSREGQERLSREKKALEAVRRHSIAPLAIKPLAYRNYGGLFFAIYPRAEVVEGEGRIRNARVFLRQLLDSSEIVPIQETDGWQRMESSASKGLLNEIGAQSLLKRIERSVLGARVPAGLIHGDLGLHNLLQTNAGNPIAIDWDRSEKNSPVFFDVLAASHFFAFRNLISGGDRNSYRDAWRLLFERDERLPFGEELYRSKGDLTLTTMTAIAVLNSISWESAPGGHDYGSWVAMCEQYLRLTDES